MIVKRSKYHYNNPFGYASKKRGFFGRLWDKIKTNIGTIIGAIVGGPAGAALGTLIQNWLTVNPDIEVTYEKTTIDAVNEDQYPITPLEENILFAWLEKSFKPTIINIANSTDQNLNIVFNKSLNSPANVIPSINKALKDISVLKAYALKLREFGEYYKTLLKTVKLSDNYVMNKTEAMFLLLDQIEKGIYKYVLDNNITGYVLVSQLENVSSISRVEKVDFDWQNQVVDASIKKYVVNTDVTTDQEPLDINNVDLNDTTSPTSTDAEVINVEGEAKPTNNKLLKTVGTTTAVLLILKALSSKNKTKTK